MKERAVKESSVASRITAALHEHFDSVVREPLPQRWLDLIRELNERERKQAEARQREQRLDRP